MRHEHGNEGVKRHRNDTMKECCKPWSETLRQTVLDVCTEGDLCPKIETTFTRVVRTQGRGSLLSDWKNNWRSDATSSWEESTPTRWAWSGQADEGWKHRSWQDEVGEACATVQRTCWRWSWATVRNVQTKQGQPL